MKLNQFIRKMKDIKRLGYVKSLRKGPTGIGYTLETLLGIKENNISDPDLEKIELKTHRVGTNNMVTLFTFNRKAWKISPLDAVKKYGSFDAKGRKGMYYTLSQKPNSYGVFIYIDASQLSVRHIDGTVIAVWSLDDLESQFNRKIPALILVYAQVEERDGHEYFFFNRAVLMHRTTEKILYSQFLNENLLVDLRIHDKGTSARNHGTGFRVKENKLIELFTEIKDLDI